MFESPYKDDRKYITSYIAMLTRDEMDLSEELVNQMFYDRIFKQIVPEESKELSKLDEINRRNSFNILCNIMHSPF